MGLWGGNTTNEKKPLYLNEADAANCYAGAAGWYLKHASGTDELLVAIGGLNPSTANTFTTLLAAPNIVKLAMLSRSNNASNIIFKMELNEKVNVVGTPFLTLSNGGSFTANAVYTGYFPSNRVNTSTILFEWGPTANVNVLSGISMSATLGNASAIYDFANTEVTVAANLQSSHGNDGASDIRPNLASLAIVYTTS